MKFQIMHESNGRIRVKMIQPRMTLDQADLLEAYLQTLDGEYPVTLQETA